MDNENNEDVVIHVKAGTARAIGRVRPFSGALSYRRNISVQLLFLPEMLSGLKRLTIKMIDFLHNDFYFISLSQFVLFL